jgi:hypothetical protein
MSTFLTILLVASMIAVVVVLVRGLVVFLLGASQDLREGDGSRSVASAVKSNKMMQYRVMFQAIAIFLVVLLMWLAGKS